MELKLNIQEAEALQRALDIASYERPRRNKANDEDADYEDVWDKIALEIQNHFSSVYGKLN